QYQEGGIERLKRTDWAGTTSELEEHRQSLEDYFRENPPRSTAEAAAAIERLTGIRRGQTQVRRFLRGMGLKFRKLGMIPAQAEADEPAKFLAGKLWPRLRQARRLRRVVCFVDAAHFVHGAFLGYLWCFVRLLVRGPSGRKRFNVLGAIDAVTGVIPRCGDTEILVGLGLARTSKEEQHGVVVRWKCGSSRKSKGIGTRGMASVAVRTVPRSHRPPRWWTRRDAR
ncbi:MAG TPA: hypothetical protein VKP69_19255, partial [Isosphaeraceae bacterium]|nr:hypothetical protein [Isosphaeraceae bacterium]